MEKKYLYISQNIEFDKISNLKKINYNFRSQIINNIPS